MLNFLSSLKSDYTHAQIESVELRIKQLKAFIKDCDQKMYDIEHEKDHYEEQLLKAFRPVRYSGRRGNRIHYK